MSQVTKLIELVVKAQNAAFYEDYDKFVELLQTAITIAEEERVIGLPLEETVEPHEDVDDDDDEDSTVYTSTSYISEGDNDDSSSDDDDSDDGDDSSDGSYDDKPEIYHPLRINSKPYHNSSEPLLDSTTCSSCGSDEDDDSDENDDSVEEKSNEIQEYAFDAIMAGLDQLLTDEVLKPKHAATIKKHLILSKAEAEAAAAKKTKYTRKDNYCSQQERVMTTSTVPSIISFRM